MSHQIEAFLKFLEFRTHVSQHHLGKPPTPMGSRGPWENDTCLERTAMGPSQTHGRHRLELSELSHIPTEKKTKRQFNIKEK